MPNSAEILHIDRQAPDESLIARAAVILCTGGVLVVPTRGLYGLAADAAHAPAVERVFALKGRPADKPLLLLIPDLEHLGALVAEVPPAAVTLMANFWPGRLTLVMRAKPEVSARLTAGTGRIGVRLPGHPVAAALLAAVGRPITATSANLSGGPGCSRVADLPPAIREGADLILDAGELHGGAGSTVVDVTCDPPRILRMGAIAPAAIERLLRLDLTYLN